MVNLNPIMVDGMGMCGACRVTVDGKTLFACVDGLEFDGHQVDFDELLARLKVYTPQEKLAYVFNEQEERN
jgi:ferredoxin--NADP+ reductase